MDIRFLLLLESITATNSDDFKEFLILKNSVNNNRPFASTISYRRATKRHRLLRPNFDTKEVKDLLISEGMKKNIPGDLIPQNCCLPKVN